MSIEYKININIKDIFAFLFEKLKKDFF